MKKSDEPEPPKKPYHAPELRLYGDLGSLTEAKTPFMGMFDGKYTGIVFWGS